jgi:hypothetical protein
MDYEAAERTQAHAGVCFGNDGFDCEGLRIANDHLRHLKPQQSRIALVDDTRYWKP